MRTIKGGKRLSQNVSVKPKVLINPKVRTVTGVGTLTHGSAEKEGVTG